jgi:type I restriction enzyme S subunit
MSVRAPVGPTNVARQLCCIGRGLAAFRPRSELDSRFLLYFLRFYEPRIAFLGLGSTFDAINRDDLEGMKILLPDLNEQRRISALLEEAYRLGRVRHYARELSEIFLQSVFLEMFGDPLSDGKNISHLDDLLEIQPQNGLYVPSESYTITGSGVQMVHMSHLFSGIVSTGSLKRVCIEESEILKYRLDENDLLIARRSLNYEGAAKPCRIPRLTEPLVFESSMIRIRPDREKVLPIYLYYYLSDESVRATRVRRYVTVSTISGINQAGLRRLQIVVPPIALQKRFAKIVRQVERLCAQHREAERQAEHLFQSLLHRSFAGALVGVARSRSVKRKPSVRAPKRTYSPGVFYRRAAIEAHVINALRGDPYLGRTKLEKIDHLIEYHCGIDLERYPVRDAAGPDDYLSRMKLEHLANKRNWFSAHDKKDGSIVKYLPKRSFTYAADKGAEAIGDKRIAVDNLLTLMRPLDTKRCEIIATLYAAWNDFLLNGRNPSDDEIVRDVLNNWRPEKQLIPERRWLRGLKWMRDNGLVPRGKGKPVIKTI